MALWRVIADRIKLYPHPNADALWIGRVGSFQVVVAKSNGYQSGDIVFFAPERAVLPPDLCPHYVNSETGVSYLGGPEHNRVQRVRLRGEYSEGVTIDPQWALQKLGVSRIEEVPLDTDLSEVLGIRKYEPPIPIQMAGDVMPIAVPHWHTHDVEPLRIYPEEFHAGESIRITEKIHGSQVVWYGDADGTELVTSKGLASKHLALKPSETNVYWRAVRQLGLWDLVRQVYPRETVQVFGEVIPVQKGFSYGQSDPTLRIFRVIVDGREVPVAEVPPALRAYWVPILYEGPFDDTLLAMYAQGREQVSGRALHIREGIVISPAMPRQAQRGFALYLKVINPKFKDSEEFIS